MVGWIKDGVQVGLVTGNNVLGGTHRLSFPPTKSGTAVGGGRVLGVVTASQLMQPCDSK